MRRSALVATAASVAIVVACTSSGGTLDSADGGTSGASGTSSGGPSGTSSVDASGTSSGDASSDGALACADSTAPKATFELKTSSPHCSGKPGSCNPQWLSILKASDKSVLTMTNACATMCGECQPIACPGACRKPQNIDVGGIWTTWTGLMFESGVCNGTTPCLEMRCAPPGRYIARMCATRQQSAGAHACEVPESSPLSPTCTDVEFDWPTTDTVRGAL